MRPSLLTTELVSTVEHSEVSTISLQYGFFQKRKINYILCHDNNDIVWCDENDMLWYDMFGYDMLWYDDNDIIIKYDIW